MDRVRFGRALGKGARLAARTALEAVDAATAAAPDTQKARSRNTVQASTPRSSAPSTASGTVQRAALREPFLSVPSGLLPAARAARAGVVGPLKQASRAVWHELTGSFYALFALSFGAGVWHTRKAIHSSIPLERHRLAAFCALTVLFLYFSISSFARARQRRTA